MTSVDVYKSAMSGGLKKFFETYEQAIKELIDKLDSEGLLLRKFTEEQVTRLQELTNSGNMTLKLSNDFYSIFDPKDVIKTKEKLSHLNKAFSKNDDFRMGEHYHAVLVNSYTALLERLKIYFLFFIDWGKLGKKYKDINGIGKALEILKQKYTSNKYLLYFDSGARNSLAHYTFFWKHGNGGKIMLCSDIFDSSPKEMSLVEFMKEIIELGVLVDGFYISLKDKFKLPEIKLEMFER